MDDIFSPDLGQAVEGTLIEFVDGGGSVLVRGRDPEWVRGRLRRATKSLVYLRPSRRRPNAAHLSVNRDEVKRLVPVRIQSVV
jgi:hypothetical protein